MRRCGRKPARTLDCSGAAPVLARNARVLQLVAASLPPGGKPPAETLLAWAQALGAARRCTRWNGIRTSSTGCARQATAALPCSTTCARQVRTCAQLPCARTPHAEACTRALHLGMRRPLTSAAAGGALRPRAQPLLVVHPRRAAVQRQCRRCSLPPCPSLRATRQLRVMRRQRAGRGVALARGAPPQPALLPLGRHRETVECTSRGAGCRGAARDLGPRALRVGGWLAAGRRSL